MPSRENNSGPPSDDTPARPRRRSRPPSGSSPIRFEPPKSELPDNALIGPSARVGASLAAPSLPVRGVTDGAEATNGEGAARQEGAASSAPTRAGGQHRIWLWAALAAVVGIPLIITLLGALTSPPHVKGIPSGHLLYLEAEAPSEKTTTLRGLYAVAPGAAPRLLAHENEPQDIDGGVREWITQPALSPDGTRLVFEKQLITILDERQSVQNQIWVMALAPGSAGLPHLVIDLTKSKLKQVVGLAWDSDSSVLFLQDGAEYSVPTDTADPPLKVPLDLHGLALAVSSDISATRGPALTESGGFAYSVQTPTGPQVLVQNAGKVTPGPAAAVFALSPAGDKIAFVPPGGGAVIRTFDLAAGKNGPDIPVRWGWSVFGRRRITSLRWSPDGTQIAFTVGKPPVPEDELFAVTLATDKTVQLPYRTGPAAWDWGR